MSSIKLFFIPHAGGSCKSYLSFKRFLNPRVKPCGIEPAGRGKRINEPFYKNLDEAAEDLLMQLESQIDEGPYAIFAHSLGTLYTYVMGKKLREKGLKEPSHIFLSGRCAPWLSANVPMLSELSDEAFIEAFISNGGLPAEIGKNKELQDFYMPILRADVGLAERENLVRTDFMFGCDLSIFMGKQDTLLTKELMPKWQEATRKRCVLYEFEGGHFYFNEQKEAVCQVINQILCEEG